MQQFFFKSQGEAFEYFFSSLHPLDVFAFYWEHFVKMFFTHPIIALQLHVFKTQKVSRTHIITESDVEVMGKRTLYLIEINISDEGRNSSGFLSYSDKLDPKRSFKIEFDTIGTAVLTCENTEFLSSPLTK